MTTTNLTISIVEKRILKPAEAAKYCDMSFQNFKSNCPVQPLHIPPNQHKYDRNDLDRWIEDLKGDARNASISEILELLK